MAREVLGNGIACPKCGYLESGVVDTRHTGGRIRRRRECAACGTRFSTHEHIVAERYSRPRRVNVVRSRQRKSFEAELEDAIDRLGDSHA